MSDDPAVAGDDPGIARRALRHQPVTTHEPSLARTRLACGLLGEHIRKQRDRLDVDTRPAILRHRNDSYAFRREALVAGDVEGARGDHDARGGSRWRKGMVAARDAARDLEVDDAVANTVPPHGLLQYDPNRPGEHRHPDAYFTKRAREPLHVPAFVDDVPAP